MASRLWPAGLNIPSHQGNATRHHNEMSPPPPGMVVMEVEDAPVLVRWRAGSLAPRGWDAGWYSRTEAKWSLLEHLKHKTIYDPETPLLSVLLEMGALSRGFCSARSPESGYRMKGLRQ